MDRILPDHKYRAVVCYISTVSGRDIKLANVIKLRCNIFSADADEPPLSVKVYWNRRNHGDGIPARGDTILIEAYQGRYQGPLKFKPLPGASVTKECTTLEDEPMATSTSKNRIRFFIGERYFKTPSARIMIGAVLARAFGISAMAMDTWLRGEGVWITCRLSQFTRFMIYRNEKGITNGFMDLHAELIPVKTFKDFYTRLADITGVDREAIKEVIHALNFSVPELETQISKAEGRRVTTELDVSDKPRFNCTMPQG